MKKNLLLTAGLLMVLTQLSFAASQTTTPSTTDVTTAPTTASTTTNTTAAPTLAPVPAAAPTPAPTVVTTPAPAVIPAPVAAPIVSAPDARLVAFQESQDAESRAFFGQQVIDRQAFIAAHQDVIEKENARFKQVMAISLAQRQGKSTAGMPVPGPQDNTFASFVAKQQSEKVAFLAKLTEEKEAFLNAHPGIH